MSYSIPKKASAYLFYVGLSDQSNTKVFKANPTLAAGDFKLSKDGGALVNLTNMPTVTPAAGVLVQVSLTASEMSADTITLVFSDQAGAEWCDLIIVLQTTALQTDDLMPLASYSAPDNVDIATILTRTDVATSTRSTYAGADTAGTTTLLSRITAALTITSGKVDVNDKSGFSLSSAGVAAIWNALITGLTVVGSIGKRLVDYVDATISSRNEIGPANSDIAAIKARTDLLPDDPASNTAVATRLAGSAYSAAPTVSQVADAVSAASDPLLNVVPGAYAVGTAGHALGGIPTVAQVVDGVWDEPIGGHVNANSTGQKLNTAASGVGSGPIQWVYTLTDVATHLPVPQAYIWATTDAIGSNIVAQGLTDNFGVVTFYLSAGTYYIWRVKAGWIFANPDAEVVA